MQSQVRTLAWLTIIYGSFGVLIGLGVFAMLGGIAGIVSVTGEGHDAQAATLILPMIGMMVVGIMTLLSLPSILAGWGLLHFKPWARLLTIVLSVFHVFNFPIGTGLAAFSLYVLLQPSVEALFNPVVPVAARPTSTY